MPFSSRGITLHSWSGLPATLYGKLQCKLNLAKQVKYDRYFYSGATFAVTELDGVRVIGQEVSDFIQKVPGMDNAH